MIIVIDDKACLELCCRKTRFQIFVQVSTHALKSLCASASAQGVCVSLFEKVQDSATICADCALPDQFAHANWSDHTQFAFAFSGTLVCICIRYQLNMTLILHLQISG